MLLKKHSMRYDGERKKKKMRSKRDNKLETPKENKRRK